MANILSYSQVKQYAANAGFTGTGLDKITAIAFAESSGNPNATNVNRNKTIDYGLTQINSIHGYGASALDPQTSMDAAYKVSNGGTNFAPWVQYNNGAYQKYLPQAQAASADTSASGFGSSVTMPNQYGYDRLGDAGLGTIYGNSAPNYSPSGGSGYGTGLTQPNPNNDFAPNSSFSDSGFSSGLPIPSGRGSDTGLQLSPDFLGSSPEGSLSTDSLGQLFGGSDNVTGGGTSSSGSPFNIGGLAAKPQDWWNTFVSISIDVLTRFGLVLVAIVLIGAGAWALARNEKR